MIHRSIIIILILFFSTQIIYCQNNKNDDEKKTLGPAKAAFYSAVLPGLGQVYNKKYWKVPIIYGALAGGVYYFNKNNDLYHKYRDAYKRRLAGFTDDEFYGNGTVPAISNDGLIRAQKSLKRNKELSILVTIGIYALNIIDANVGAHLLQFNVSEDLSFRPYIENNYFDFSQSAGIKLKINLD